MTKSDRDFFLAEIRKRPTKPPAERISEYVQGRRIMPSSTPFPGLWDNRRTPYAVEIMDNMSPHSPVIRTVVMKGAQLGLTAAAENVVGYWMDESPSEILFVSASDDLLKKWATKRLEPLIDSLGIREKIIGSRTMQSGPRGTGDKVLSKQYIGGNLDMASAQSAASLRSDSKRILIRDEIDGAPPMLRTGEGNWLSVSYARTNAWGSRKKILDFSTPTTYVESLIWRAYEAGDQRKYIVPCPHCGERQELVWHGGQSQDTGLQPVFSSGGHLRDAVYICPKCAGTIHNYHKTDMLADGAWVPTVAAREEAYRSYHISSLYSPVGMLSWKEFYQHYIDITEDPEGARSFCNLYTGMPYRETGARPSAEKVQLLAGTYTRGTVPYGVLYLTMGIDVQRGSQTDPNNPPRLEAQILGHGAGYRIWSIDYWRIEGPIDDPYSGAWEELNERAEAIRLTFHRESDNHPFPVQIVFVDSGDGATQTIAEAFCERWPMTFPIKGVHALKRNKNESPDVDASSPTDFKRYRAEKIGAGENYYYLISTNRYKQLIYNRINNTHRQDGPVQKPGFIDFPRDYGPRYYEMLTAEERRADGTFDAGGRRNEALDTFVYAMCAADVYFDSRVSDLQATIRRRRIPPVPPEEVKRWTLRDMSQAAGVEFPYGQPEKRHENSYA